MKLSKELYNKDTLIKTAYVFTDRAYIHLDMDESDYIVEIIPKDTTDLGIIYKEFENELIFQEARKTIATDTKTIREMIIARAFASTMVSIDGLEETSQNDYSADEILKDWFEENG